MTYSDAFDFVRNKMSIVYPNPGLIEQLKLFEKELIEKKLWYW